MWEQVHTSWARSGAHHPNTHFTHRDGPAPLGSASGTLVHSVKMDACSPGEGRAISCPVAGRARKGAGRWYPYAPQYSSHHYDAGRALQARPWVNGTDPDQGTHPLAGRVSEGRIHGTWKPGGRAAPEATAVASIGHSSALVNRYHRCESGAGGSVPLVLRVASKGRAHAAERAGRPEWPRVPIALSARQRLSPGSPAHGKSGHGPLRPAGLVRTAADSLRPTAPQFPRDFLE
jgi:hypothetical protein